MNSAADTATPARATLDAWRERGADRLNPVRFRFIEALDRRAAGFDGETRRLLDERVSKLLQEYEGDLARREFGAGVESGKPMRPARGALGGLIAYVSSQARVGTGGAADDESGRPPSWPEPEMLDYLRKTWSQLSAVNLLRESRERVPGNAGPLNSSSLVHKALSLMSEVSPGYFQQFLSYVDALSWLEQMSGSGVPAAKDTPHAGGSAKNARAKPRQH